MADEETDRLIITCNTENVANTTGFGLHCFHCQASIWVSHSTLDAVKKNGHKIEEAWFLCLDCTVKQAAEDGIEDDEIDFKVLGPTQKQIEESGLSMSAEQMQKRIQDKVNGMIRAALASAKQKK